MPVKLSLDTLLQMSGAQVRETMRKLGSSSEECSRLSAALSCLRGATETGGEVRGDRVPWISEPLSQDSASPDQQACSTQHAFPTSLSHIDPSSHPCGPPYSVPATPPAHSVGNYPPRHTVTPPLTPPLRRNAHIKSPRTPPLPSQKLLQLPDGTLTRSKSHESQLANLTEDTPTNKSARQTSPPLNVQVNGRGDGFEDPGFRSLYNSSHNPLPGSTCCPTPATPTIRNHTPYTTPATPPLLEELLIPKNNQPVNRSSPHTMRRDIGLPVTHRFSTKSWLSQTCQVCQKSMMFGVKCKHCRLKCHNKCTKEAPPCRISFLPISNIQRTVSVPSDINNQVDRTVELQQFCTLPKALNKKDQLDSSSNPSSTTSSTPSSPAPFQQSSAPTPPPNPSPMGHRDNRFYFPAACYSPHRQRFIFPDVSVSAQPQAFVSDGLCNESPQSETGSIPHVPELPATEQEAEVPAEEKEEHPREENVQAGLSLIHI